MSLSHELDLSSALKLFSRRRQPLAGPAHRLGHGVGDRECLAPVMPAQLRQQQEGIWGLRQHLVDLTMPEYDMPMAEPIATLRCVVPSRCGCVDNLRVSQRRLEGRVADARGGDDGVNVVV